MKRTMRPSRLTCGVAGVSVRLRGYRWPVSVVMASFFLFANATGTWGQLNGRTATVTLVATLESLSVGATPRDGLEFPTNGMEGARLFPLAITSSWAVPSNLTTVKVTQDGITLFAQKAGETNRVARRIDNVDVVLTSDKNDGQTDGLPRGVVRILVQAL